MPEDDRYREPLGILRAGFGGIDQDPQVVARDDEGVAIQGDESHVGMVDDLVPGLVPGRAGLGRLPQLGEARAVRGQPGDQAAQLAVGGIRAEITSRPGGT